MKEQIEKQAIEEMAKDIAEAINHNSAVDVIRHGLICINSEGVTRELYDDGYRKQEWISVDERLPEESGKYLVVSNLGNILALYYSERHKLFNSFDSYSTEHAKVFAIAVTHWMPLPEAPKMKGGAE